MTDAIERAAAAICGNVRGHYYRRHKDHFGEARAALASLRPGDKIKLADGKECWIAPVEATDAMYHAGLKITRDSGYGHCSDVVGGAIYRAMRDACKEDEG